MLGNQYITRNIKNCLVRSLSKKSVYFSKRNRTFLTTLTLLNYYKLILYCYLCNTIFLLLLYL